MKPSTDPHPPAGPPASPPASAAQGTFVCVSRATGPEAVTPSRRPAASAGAAAATPGHAVQIAARTPPPAADAAAVRGTATDVSAAGGGTAATHEGRVSSEQQPLPSYPAYAAAEAHAAAVPPCGPAPSRDVAAAGDFGTTAVGSSLDGAAASASALNTAATHAPGAEQASEEEEREDGKAAGSQPLHVFAAQRGSLHQQKQQAHESDLQWNQQQQQPVQQNPPNRNRQQHLPQWRQRDEEEEEEENEYRVMMRQQLSDNEVWQNHDDRRASLATQVHDKSPLRGLPQQHAEARRQRYSPRRLAATAETATASTARVASSRASAAEAAVYFAAARPAEAAEPPAGHVELAAGAHAAAAAEAQSAENAALTTRDTVTAKPTEPEAAAPSAAAVTAGGGGKGKEAVDLLQQQARQMLEVLRSDTRGCTYAESKRLDASLAQLQPEAEAIQKMAEEVRRMHQHSLELKAKTENNLLLIERLKEEDKAFDEELDVLPQKLQSLSEYKATGEDELRALRREYQLVSRQGEHALQAWEKKLKIYQHALGLRLQQSEEGGPTLVEFVDLQPLLAEDERQQLGQPAQQHTQQQDNVLKQQEEKQRGKKCCCFSFRLAEGGRLAEAWSFPTIEMYGELARGFAAGRISLAFFVAAMRRQFKRLLEQDQKQRHQHQQQRQWHLQQQEQEQQLQQTWQHQRRHEHQQQFPRRGKGSGEQAGTVPPAGAAAPVKANFSASVPLRERWRYNPQQQQQEPPVGSERFQQKHHLLQRRPQEQTRQLQHTPRLQQQQGRQQQLQCGDQQQPWQQQQQQLRGPNRSPDKTRVRPAAASLLTLGDAAAA